MEKELIRGLIKALKSKSEDIPIDPRGLPELPSLQMEQNPMPQAVEEQTAIEQIDPGFSLSTKGINYRNQLADVLLNQKGVNIDSDRLNGHIGFDKSLDVTGNIPIDNGSIRAAYSSKPEEGRNVRLEIAKKLFGGDLSLGMNNQEGDKSYNMKFQRNF